MVGFGILASKREQRNEVILVQLESPVRARYCGVDPSGLPLALMTVAVYDATIAAWDSKYAYKRPRPSEADPSVGHRAGAAQPVVSVGTGRYVGRRLRDPRLSLVCGRPVLPRYR